MRISILLSLSLAVFGCSSSGSSANGSGGAGGVVNGAAGSSVSAGTSSSSAGANASDGGASSGGSNAEAGSLSSDAGAGGSTTWSPIPPDTRWQWQLTGTIDTSQSVAIFDIDLFENDAATVTALHAKGAKVICYVSVGSYEDWRPDAKDFPAAVLGKDYPGWPGEKFLDIRALDTLGPILQKRMDLCVQKGFDGLEPDNMDVFEGGSSNSGFPLTQEDGVAFAEWLVAQAHARGLSIGQKNTAELASQLSTQMDWALTEDCFKDGWCADMQPYIDHQKAVLMAEYTDTGVNFTDACTWGKAHRYSPILKGRDLDAPVTFCP